MPSILHVLDRGEEAVVFHIFSEAGTHDSRVALAGSLRGEFPACFIMFLTEKEELGAYTLLAHQYVGRVEEKMVEGANEEGTFRYREVRISSKK